MDSDKEYFLHTHKRSGKITIVSEVGPGPLYDGQDDQLTPHVKFIINYPRRYFDYRPPEQFSPITGYHIEFDEYIELMNNNFFENDHYSIARIPPDKLQHEIMVVEL
jgi:hypothetical protein